MADVTTKINIQAETKGLAEATRDTSKLESTLSGVGKGAGKSSSGLKQILKTLRSELKQSIRDSSALGDAYEKQNKQLKALQKEYELLAKSIRAASKAKSDDAQQTTNDAAAGETRLSRLRRFFGRGGGGGGQGGGGSGGDGTGAGGAPGAPDPRRGALTQGFLQGVLPEGFIQRGPGAFSQAAGTLLGRTVRGVAGAGMELLASPLSGSGAAISAASRIPVVGGVAGAVLQQSLGAAQEEASTQKGFQSLMPYLRSGRSPGALGTLNALRATSGGIGMALGGLSANESAALVGQMAAAGGGYGTRYSQGTLREAFAAQAGLGIDTGTSGVLARGDALGATTGRGASALAKSVADAVSLGLQGSEITKYVQGIAGNIEGFASTGIKVDATAQGAVGRVLETTGGYAGVRAAALSRGVGATMDQLADSGPQSPGQMLMLRAAGFDPSRPDSFYEAQARLDDASPGDRARIFSSARATALRGMRGLSGYGKAAAYRRFAQENGMNLRIGEARREVLGNASSADISRALTAPDAQAAMAQTETQAQYNTTSAAQSLSTMANMQSATGQQYVGSMLEMDKTARAALNKVAHAGSMFLDFAAKVQKFGADLMGVGQGSGGISTPQSAQ